jgi:fructokinase
MLHFGGIEAGGTKFVCAAGSGPADIQVSEFPTTTPEETVERAVAFLREHAPLSGVGIGSFGPINSKGFITSTPKLSWRNFDFAGTVRRALNVPVVSDTDVNAAALGEYRWGAGRRLETFLYITVGTGIGGGGIVNGRLMHGRSHPEMGHVRIPHDRVRDPYPGFCPYHGDCLEGLASAPAIEARWGKPAHLLPADHDAWAMEAGYLASGLVNWICTVSPERIILGGGVMNREELYPMVRSEVEALLNGYVDVPEIVAPGLGERAGVLGAIALAQTAV